MSVRICYTDTETSGLTKSHCVHQISCIVADLEGDTLTIVDKFNAHAMNFSTDLVDPQALRISGIDAKKLLTYPDPRTTFKAYHEFLIRNARGGKMFFGGWNARFDEDMIRAFFDKNGKSKEFGKLFWTPCYDVMMIVLDVFKESRHTFENFKLTTVAKSFGVNQSQTFHDASVDIDTTVKLHALVKSLTIINMRKAGKK